jgi:hypothetical protein
MRRVVLTYGLIAGALLSLMLAVSVALWDRIGFDRAMVVSYTTMVAAFLLVYVGVRSYRDTVAGGTIGFGRAFGVGLLIAVVASLCYVVTWEIIYFGFASDFMERYAEHALAKARAGGATEAELAAQAGEMRRYAELYANPFFNAAITFLEPLPVSVLMSLVSAVLLRRRARPGEGDVSIRSASPA